MRFLPFVSLWLSVLLTPASGVARAAAPTPRAGAIGAKVANFSLAAPPGKPFALHEMKDRKAIVVVFLSFECPVCTSYLTALREIARSYEARGVAFVGICPTRDDEAAIQRQARDFKVGFPVLRDDTFAAADALGGQITPEAFVLDGQFILRYRGRIDDAYAARLKKNARVSSHDLRTALDQLLAGKAVATPVTTPVGCPVVREERKAAGGKVTFYRDVLPVLQQRCQGCHRPGEIGPFSLLTYTQAVRWAADIKDYTVSRKMPPWKPAEGKKFRDERKMTEDEIRVVAAWVDGGTPEGDAKDAPPPMQFPDGWQLGKPDLVLTPEADYTLGATGPDVFRCFVLPTGLTEDRYVVAYEVRPGNPRIVHHALNLLDTRGTARKRLAEEENRVKSADEVDRGPGYSTRMAPGFLPRGDIGGWAPGLRPHYWPDGVGYYVPAGSDIVLQVHYHRNGKVEKDRTRLGLYFAKKPVPRPLQPLAIPGLFATIPAGAENHFVKGSLWVAQDCTVYSVIPHMHLLGKKIKVTMTPPGGTISTIVRIDDWDYNWQEMYFLEEPLRVKAGTRFTVEAVYDNSAKNPNNPSHPPRTVFLGETTTNEMCFGFLVVATDDPGWIGVRFSEKGLVFRPPGPGPGPAEPKAPMPKPGS
jgi:peroxiredoxin